MLCFEETWLNMLDKSLPYVLNSFDKKYTAEQPTIWHNQETQTICV